MNNKPLQKTFSILAIIVLLVLLVGVRAFERQLFYDPFLSFFEGNYLNMSLPKYDALWLFLMLLFRYFLNSLLSLGILYFIFKEYKLIQFVSILYVFLFLFLILGFYFILHIYESDLYLVLFYVRRFLIQPLFLILFIPAFYYQKRQE